MKKKRTAWFYFAGRWLMIFCLRLLTNWEIRGRENVPREGSLLIVANHMNNADPPLVAVSVPCKTVFMAKEELFKSPIIRYFVRSFGAFPVNRTIIDRNALRQAKEVLDGGWCLVMFPEGMRSRTGKLIQAFPGSALIAARSKTTVLPVGITGTEKMDGWKWIFRRPRVIVNIGKPFTLQLTNGKVTKGELAGLTDDLMCHIAELLPVKYHGYYADKVTRQ
jgi:1-acyl-sn-glycerol-3-phosphate acyltransferase